MIIILRATVVVLITVNLLMTGCRRRIAPGFPEPAASSLNQEDDVQRSAEKPSEDTAVCEDAPVEPAASMIAGEADEYVSMTGAERILEARKLAVKALNAYESGRYKEAGIIFDNAQIMLLSADIPEDMKTLKLLSLNLPEPYQDRNLEAIYRDSLRQSAEDKAEIKDEQIEVVETILDDNEFIENEIRNLFRKFGEDSPSEEGIRIFVEEVEKYIRYYQTEKKDWYERSYRRKHRYWPMIRQIFEEKRMPVELGYLAFVESGFVIRARSRAGARGMWQFIRGTGRRYGLQINYYTDERLDPYKSGVAAREYLLDLIAVFGSRSFLLAMASYNAGENRIQKCLMKLDNPFEERTFWHIQDCLPRETREYIPRIMAAAVVGRDPERFGFDMPTTDEIFKRYDTVIVPSPYPLSQLAAAAGISTAELTSINSDVSFSYGKTPVNNFPLLVPKEKRDDIAGILKKAEPEHIASASGTSSEDQAGATSSGETQTLVHCVSRGETLTSIGKKYGVSYRKIAEWNNIRPPYMIKRGQRLKILRTGSATPEKIIYTVKKGNFLVGIANIFGVNFRDIMRWNKMSRGTIHPGQKLVIYPKKNAHLKTYRVRRGDTLSKIARAFGVTINDIAIANGISKKRVIYPGQRLYIYAGS